MDEKNEDIISTLLRFDIVRRRPDDGRYYHVGSGVVLDDIVVRGMLEVTRDVDLVARLLGDVMTRQTIASSLGRVGSYHWRPNVPGDNGRGHIDHDPSFTVDLWRDVGAGSVRGCLQALRKLVAYVNHRLETLKIGPFSMPGPNEWSPAAPYTVSALPSNTPPPSSVKAPATPIVQQRLEEDAFHLRVQQRLEEETYHLRERDAFAAPHSSSTEPRVEDKPIAMKETVMPKEATTESTDKTKLAIELTADKAKHAVVEAATQARSDAINGAWRAGALEALDLAKGPARKILTKHLPTLAADLLDTPYGEAALAWAMGTAIRLSPYAADGRWRRLGDELCVHANAMVLQRFLHAVIGPIREMLGEIIAKMPEDAVGDVTGS